MIAGGIQLSHSCVKVLDVLARLSYNDGVSQQQLTKETKLSERAIKYALKELMLRGLVSELAVANDLRRKTYKTEG